MGTVARSISARSVHIFFFFFKLSLPSYATAIPPQRSERLVHRRRVFSRQAATITLHGANPPPSSCGLCCVAIEEDVSFCESPGAGLASRPGGLARP